MRENGASMNVSLHLLAFKSKQKLLQYSRTKRFNICAVCDLTCRHEQQSVFLVRDETETIEESNLINRQGIVGETCQTKFSVDNAVKLLSNNKGKVITTHKDGKPRINGMKGKKHADLKL